jgi:4-hydroxybenzoate polyprenyltransferase
MVVLLAALIGLASTDGDVAAGRLGLVLLAVLFSQLAIGWSNDYLDRESDAVYQPSKPVPSGLVDARRMPMAIGLALAGCLATGTVLGIETLPALAGGCAALA